ncbi:guanylate kinase [Zophobihabitans entericus]|uniref:Guanylate kinase n=1 Tax=Zophobihabitans entericus TaxID=1635327 RepID=A0A6G9IBC4_9GAMM|nr:guanylate kinase [Zophobihabitans entericus]QIQ21535.1 guanylate kinase [Zophobihabitans entericus]
MTQNSAQTGTLYIISAPSGAGKSSLIKAYLNLSDNHPTKVSISHTTRAPRPGEQHGEHYYFVDKAEFEVMISRDDFVEHAQVYENYYGTSRQAIEGNLAAGIDIFLDIDWQGAQQVRAKMPSAKSIFILPPSLTELENRLFQRGQDSPETIQKRMLKAKSEISHYSEYDYLIINDNFEQSLFELRCIIQTERLTLDKQSQQHHALLESLLK